MTSLTEKQAREKLCCGPAGTGEKIMDSDRQWCVASVCLAWRWRRAKETKAYLKAVQDLMKEKGISFNVATQEVFKTVDLFDETEGYCGLAGKPE